MTYNFPYIEGANTTFTYNSNGTISINSAGGAGGVSSWQGTANQINPTTATTGMVTASLSSTLFVPGTLNITNGASIPGNVNSSLFYIVNGTKTGGGNSITCASNDTSCVSLNIGIIGGATAAVQGSYIDCLTSGVNINTIYMQTSGGGVAIGTLNSITPADGGLYVKSTIALGTTSYGGGVGVLAMANANTPPGSTPSGGGVIYIESGALKYKGSSGTVTVLALA